MIDAEEQPCEKGQTFQGFDFNDNLGDEIFNGSGHNCGKGSEEIPSRSDGSPNHINKIVSPAVRRSVDLACAETTPTEHFSDLEVDKVPAKFCLKHDETGHLDDIMQPLSERWSPLGANYDDSASRTSELISPVSELELMSCAQDYFRLRTMEKEQELLTTSLMALTSHFAHVQLRVRQIVEAPKDERDQLLKDLEEFAFRGIPDPLCPSAASGTVNQYLSDMSHQERATRQRQFELIEYLKAQLSDLEKYAYDSGAPVLPQHILLEKQKIIIDELKNKLNLKVEERDLPQLSSEELKNHIGNAIGEFVGPLKMKEKLVTQLKTQITDLERFIAFLQCDSDDSNSTTMSCNEKPIGAYNSYSAKKKKISAARTTTTHLVDKEALTSPNTGHASSQHSENLSSKAIGLVDKASILMQMFATTYFAPKPNRFQANTLKKTSKGNHWGDLRAQLEVDIQEIASLAATLCFDKEKLARIRRSKSLRKAPITSKVKYSTCSEDANFEPSCSHHSHTSSSDSDDDEYDHFIWDKHRRRVAHTVRQDGDSISAINKELTAAVRKNFANTLQLLMQHGLRAETESATSAIMLPFMRCLTPSPLFDASTDCSSRKETSLFTSQSSAACHDVDSDDGASYGFFGYGKSRQMHAWELILRYYHLKHGDEYNNTAARRLSQSFRLDIVDSNKMSAKHSLLSAIGMIIATHKPYKRSYTAHFKAFVCAGLNSHQLEEWLKLIVSCNDLIDTYYTASSYVARTGFRDSLRSISILSKYDFDLPVDLAIRHFRNI